MISEELYRFLVELVHAGATVAIVGDLIRIRLVPTAGADTLAG